MLSFISTSPRELIKGSVLVSLGIELCVYRAVNTSKFGIIKKTLQIAEASDLQIFLMYTQIENVYLTGGFVRDFCPISFEKDEKPGDQFFAA